MRCCTALRYGYDLDILDRLAACLASYLGHFQRADTYRLRLALWRRWPFLAQYFAFDPAAPALARTYRVPPNLSSAAQQYRHFRQAFSGDALFFQVGRFVEFYQPDDAGLAARLGLSPLPQNRRGARWGFPVAHARRHLRRLLAEGVAVACVGETGRYLTRAQERVPLCRFEPAAGEPAIPGGRA